MKKCIVISDSFKGTLSSIEICAIARQSIPKLFPDCEVVTIPVADGGEGTVSSFIKAIGAEPVKVYVTGPYGEPIQAVYARNGKQAIIEMSAAAGLPMVVARCNPETTTTYGVGQMIRHAVENGCNDIILGLGGSCTNDGGCGCAVALGALFLDDTNAKFVPVGKTLNKIGKIDLTETKRILKDVNITVMCDVKNPLYGKTGAAYVFGPQKGADKEMVLRLDSQLQKLDHAIQKNLGLSLANIPGAGAAGGMGAGCMAFFGAELKSGIEVVLDTVDLERQLTDADLVITGEGRIDSQSIHGKVISGIARRTKPRGIPLIAIVGSITESASMAYEMGVTAMFGIDREAVALEEYADRSRICYQYTLEDVLRLIQAIEQSRMFVNT